MLVFAGCGNSDRMALGEVTGTVTYQGQPLKAGTIIFEVPGARPANGTIVEGQITDVTTYVPGDGVPLGKAQIAVFAISPAAAPAASTTTPATPDQMTGFDVNYMGSGSSLIPAKYNNPADSGLSWEIEPGPNEVALVLAE